MDSKIEPRQSSKFWYYFWQFLYLIPIAVTIHYCQIIFLKQQNFRYKESNLELIETTDSQCKRLSYEIAHLQREIVFIRQELEELFSLKNEFSQNLDTKINTALDRFYADQIGMFDYASDYAGGSIISTPNTESYPSKFSIRLFSAFDWTTDSEPGVILQHRTFPGNCYSFYGNNGRMRIKLGRSIFITHVSLEHLRIGENLNSAPKEFQVLGLGQPDDANLGRFVYDLNDSIIQTFRVIPTNQTFRALELRILSNHGNDELTCVCRFRVHSLNLNLK